MFVKFESCVLTGERIFFAHVGFLLLHVSKDVTSQALSAAKVYKMRR